MNYTFVTSIVTAAQRDSLLEMIEDLHIEGAVDLWSVPLSASGAAPATHYCCEGWMHNDLIELLPLDTVTVG